MAVSKQPYKLDGTLGEYTVTAVDEYGNTATTTFTDAPKVGSVTVGTQSPNPVTAGSSANYTITVTRGTGPGSSGAFNASLTIISTLPAGVTYSFNPNPVRLGPHNNSATATLTIYTASSTPAGSYKFTVNAATSATDYAESDGTLYVQAPPPTNKPPTLTLPPLPSSINEMEEWTFTVTATDPDIPANTLTFSLVDAPDGAEIDSETGEFKWTPSEAQGPSTYKFKVVVSDGELTDEEEITVTVNEVNEPPVLDPIGDKSVPWGETLTFTATASDPDIPSNTLTFSLINAPASANIDSSTGKFTWTPDPSQIGQHTFKIRVTDNGSPPLYDEEEITVTVGKRATTLVYGGDLSGQYSDPVTVTATLTDALTGNPIVDKKITFNIGTQSNTGDTDGSGVATTTITLNQPAGSYTVESVFYGDDLYLPSSDSDSFTIEKETVTIKYTGDTYVITAGPSVSTAPVRLSARLTQDDGYSGNLALATVDFILQQGSSPSYTISNVPVNSLGEALTTLNVQVGTYLVTVKVSDGNQYWTQTEVDQEVLAVISGIGSQMVTGGGWIPDSDSINGKGNFGFTVQYQRRGAPKGQFIYLFRGSDGYNYLIKSNSWEGGGLSFTGPKSAFFTGRCTVQEPSGNKSDQQPSAAET